MEGQSDPRLDRGLALGPGRVARLLGIVEIAADRLQGDVAGATTNLLLATLMNFVLLAVTRTVHRPSSYLAIVSSIALCQRTPDLKRHTLCSKSRYRKLQAQTNEQDTNTERAVPTERNHNMASTTLPTRSVTNDTDAIPDEDSSETTKLFNERLNAWKHACGYLEDYVSASEKVEHAHGKEYEKVLKTVSHPLKEGHHFDQTLGGIAGMFDNIRSNTQGISNSHCTLSSCV